ncbi:MAG: hypothetical protein AAF715_05895 [Myxococcota bacterium]
MYDPSIQCQPSPDVDAAGRRRRRRPRWRRWGLGAAAAVAVSLGGPSTSLLFDGLACAHAHGRFPLAGQVAVDPNDPLRVFVRTTYGMLVTEDGSNSWAWICPEGPGFDADLEDPSILVAGDGSILVGTFNGLSRAPDVCAFTDATGTPSDAFFVDVRRGSTPSVIRAISSNGIGPDAFDVAVWASSDDGASFSRLGTAPPADVLALTLGTSRADDDRIYISGRGGTVTDGYDAVVLRSDDAGATWQRFIVPGGDEQTLPYIGAVDPVDPDIFYVGLVRIDQDLGVTYYGLLVTQDGGASFTEAFTRETNMPGFALSPDGTRIAIGGADEGLWTADASTLDFTQVNDAVVRCLTWTESGLYACTDQFVDGFNLAVSTDEGATLTPLSMLSSPCGPPTCDATTPTGEFCPAEWVIERLELGATTCDDGEGGGGGGAMSSGQGGSGAGTTGPPGGNPSAPSPGGCGCRVAVGAPSSRSGAVAPWAWLLGLALARRGRRLPRGRPPR